MSLTNPTLIKGHLRFSSAILALLMAEPAKERWVVLCEQAAVEKDPDKLLELIREINRLLAERDARLRGKPKTDT
jgi:hypothetical protein